jgi:hypothetical protein
VCISKPRYYQSKSLCLISDQGVRPDDRCTNCNPSPFRPAKTFSFLIKFCLNGKDHDRLPEPNAELRIERARDITYPNAVGLGSRILRGQHPEGVRA